MLARARALAAAAATAAGAATRRWPVPAWAPPPRWSLLAWTAPPAGGPTALRPSVVARVRVAPASTSARPPRGHRVAVARWAGSGCRWGTGAPPTPLVVVVGRTPGGSAVAMAPRRRGGRGATATAVATAGTADPPANGDGSGDAGGGSGDGGGGGGGDGERAATATAAAAAAAGMATTAAAVASEAPRRGGRRSVTAATKRGKAATVRAAPASAGVANERGGIPPVVAEEMPASHATVGVDTRPPALAAKADRILSVLKATYPTPPPSFLDHTDAYTLLVAVLLSARNLDARVNQVTPGLFAAAPTPAALAAMTVPEVLDHIRTLGLAPQKAVALVKLGRQLVENHGGVVPSDEDALTALPGVGNKTAAVVRCLAFGVPTFPVDTHILRLSNRWGLTTGNDTDKASIALQAAFPDRAEWHALHLRLILFGREHCPALRHDMDMCPMCSWAATTEAVAANRRGGKFVPVAKHAAPWAIRGPGVTGVAANTAAAQTSGGDATSGNGAVEAPSVAARKIRKATITATTAEVPAANTADAAASAAAQRATRGRRRKSSPPPPLVTDVEEGAPAAGEELVATPRPSNDASAAVAGRRTARGRKRKASPSPLAAAASDSAANAMAVEPAAAPTPTEAVAGTAAPRAVRGRKRMASPPPLAIAATASDADAVPALTAAEPAVAGGPVVADAAAPRTARGGRKRKSLPLPMRSPSSDVTAADADAPRAGAPDTPRRRQRARHGHGGGGGAPPVVTGAPSPSAAPDENVSAADVGAVGAEVFGAPEPDAPVVNNVDAVAVEVFGSPLRDDISGSGDATIGDAAAADGDDDCRRGHDSDGDEGGMSTAVLAPVTATGAANALAAGRVLAAVGGRRGRARGGLAATTSTGPVDAKVAAGKAAPGQAAPGVVAAAKATTGKVAAKAVPARRTPRRGAAVPPAPDAAPPSEVPVDDTEEARAGVGGGGATPARRSGRSRAAK